MYNLLPNHLLSVAENVKEMKDAVEADLKCSCGCDLFHLYKNVENQEERIKRENWEQLLRHYNGGGYSDKNGNLYLTTKGFLGLNKKKIKIEKESIPEYHSIIKAQCHNCNKEYIIFDSSIHGYDALAESKTLTPNNNVVFELLCDSLQDGSADKTKIKIENNLDYNDLLKEYENLSPEQFANAFSCINIYALRDGKYKCVFTQHTI